MRNIAYIIRNCLFFKFENSLLRTILYMNVVILIFLMSSCTTKQEILKPSEKETIKGKLFIIGGGKRSPSLMDSLIKASELTESSYIVVLPMASEEIDSACYYSTIQFRNMGCEKVYAMNFETLEDMTNERIDSLKGAKLIYISGGDQNKFMKIVLNTPVYSAIHQAYRHGAVIAGTSAGAAVMSEKMITGNRYKSTKSDSVLYENYTGEYTSIKAHSIEIAKGLGLVKSIIVDQHFIKRMRMNRLITSSLENPIETLIGIDESTAILISGNKVKVFGESQVIVLKHNTAETTVQNGLLGGRNLELNVYLPNEEFTINELEK